MDIALTCKNGDEIIRREIAHNRKDAMFDVVQKIHCEQRTGFQRKEGEGLGTRRFWRLTEQFSMEEARKSLQFA